MPRKVVIIGHGLVGAQIGHELLVRGHDVQWIDAGLKDAASALSIGLIKESWLRGLNLDVPQAMRLLDARYGLRTEELGKAGVVHILEGVRIQRHTPIARIKRGLVVGITKRDQDQQTRVQLVTGEDVLADVVIVTAGWRSGDLLPVASNVFPGYGEVYAYEEAPGNVLKNWAPYRQLILVRHCDGYWWGSDGLAVLQLKSHQMARTQAMLEAEGAKGLRWKRAGARPFTHSKMGFCRQVRKDRWVVTGGRKSSTALATQWARIVADNI